MRAYNATLTGMSVYKAARVYKVPERTLRDRTQGNVALDVVVGHQQLFSMDQERALVEHIKHMARIGYGFGRKDIQRMAREYAATLKLAIPTGDSLSNRWFYGLLKRWPDLKVAKPQKLSLARAKSASKDAIKAYFEELKSIITSNDLHLHPEKIFNIDETGVSTEHSPSKIVCEKASVAQAVTSPRSNNVTIIAGGNAIGHAIPPYYVFPGKRWNEELLNGAAYGADGEMSETGWSNSTVFANYLTKHFLKYAGICSTTGEKSLVLFDGHRSHISLTLSSWAESHGLILFVLPPHTSHLTQPLDVSVFGPMKLMYNRECQSYMHANPGISITKHCIAALTNKPYVKAMSAENLVSGFRKTGIFPFDSDAITKDSLAPSTIYREQDTCTPVPAETTVPTSATPTAIASVQQPQNSSANFFDRYKITEAVKKPRRKFVPPFLSGNLQKPQNIDILSSVKTQKKTTTLCKKPASKQTDPKPSTSGLSNGGGPINLSPEDDDTDSSMSVADEELCCVCGKFEPDYVRQCTSVIFTKWAQCDVCGHWTHLIYCTDVRVVRRGSEFRCPHCPAEI